jgi:hypothetical protein
LGKSHDEITPDLAEWIARQRMFFVATAPLAANALLNCSPKGLDTLRVLGPRAAAYLDLTGSGIETVAHLRENGRIVLMFCAFEGPPKIVRLHGRGIVLTRGDPMFADLRPAFGPEWPGERSIVHVEVTRVSDSCGFGVPRYDFAGDRDQLTKWAQAKGEAGLGEYRAAKNARSVEGLPGM